MNVKQFRVLLIPQDNEESRVVESYVTAPTAIAAIQSAMAVRRLSFVYFASAFVRDVEQVRQGESVRVTNYTSRLPARSFHREVR